MRAALAFVLLTGCCFAPEAGATTDDPARRAEATLVARAYLDAHRAELLEGATTPVIAERVQGGTIAGASELAFEITLELVDQHTRYDLPRSAPVDVVVYVVDVPSRAIGAQTRSAVGAVLTDLGGRLDQRFTSRD